MHVVAGPGLEEGGSRLQLPDAARKLLADLEEPVTFSSCCRDPCLNLPIKIETVTRYCSFISPSGHGTLSVRQPLEVEVLE